MSTPDKKDSPLLAKRLFDSDLAFSRIGDAVRPLPKAALFELADEGFRSPFEQLLACIISIRTYDEVTLPTARRLFALFPPRHLSPGACPMGGCRVGLVRGGGTSGSASALVRAGRKDEERARGQCAAPRPTGLERAVTWDRSGGAVIGLPHAGGGQ